ncbi:MAG: hypothetical protein HGA78_04830 [Nitrospirales bacterium]|nr:hypothetical protein [Nitrospirales bacterium]
MGSEGINKRLLTCEVQKGDWVIAYAEADWRPLFYGKVEEIRENDLLFIARWGGKARGGYEKVARRVCEVFKRENEACAAYHRRLEQQIQKDRKKRRGSF